MQENENIILNDNPNEILYINFNQDGTCMAIGTENGFKIININPFLDLYYKDLKGGIGIIEMLNKSNIIGLVGGGKKPKYQLNHLILYDVENDKEISKIKVKKKILNMKLRENKIYIVNIDKIFVFDFNSLNLIDILETKNRKGLISICYKEDIIAYPDTNHEGTVKIKYNDQCKEYTLKAHKTPLNCIQLNQDGTMIGTCSLKGTLIRVYNISNSQLIREVRRGAESANVNCISFDISKKYFLVASDRKTIHLFFLLNNYVNNNENQINDNTNTTQSNSVGEEINNSSNSMSNNEDLKKKNHQTEFDNKKSIFGGMSNFFNVGKRYFTSEWSFSKFKINSLISIAIFGPDNSIFVSTYDGKYYQASFDPLIGGECIKIQEEKF